MNDPVAEMVKREKARVKFAESAVHVIPLVLLLCTIFSGSSQIQVSEDHDAGRIRVLLLGIFPSQH